MNRLQRLSIALLILSLPLACVHAQETPATPPATAPIPLLPDEPTIKLPAGEPLLSMVLPNSVSERAASIAVSKALVAEKWTDLQWFGSITSAKYTYRKVNVEVFVVAGPAYVKLYANFTDDSGMEAERRTDIGLSQLDKLEKRIATELKLRFHKARGDNNTDTAD